MLKISSSAVKVAQCGTKNVHLTLAPYSKLSKAIQTALELERVSKLKTSLLHFHFGA